MWYLFKNTKLGGERGGIKSGVRTPVLPPHLKSRGRGIFGKNIVMLWETMVIFGANTVIFGENMVVFGRKIPWYLKKMEMVEEKGRVKS